MPCLRQAAGLVVAACLSSGLSGCGNDNAAQPFTDFFHNIEGGVISQQRPPPPGVDDPYPNLATIPPKPPAPDINAQLALADQLAAQRDSATAAAAAAPIVALPKPPAPPKPQPADPNANRVVVDAAASPTPSTAAPAPSDAAAADAAMAAVPPVPAAIVSGPLPSLAAAPPLPPTGLGDDFKILTGSAPPPAPAASATAPVGNAVAVAFTPGSALLPPSATLNLRRFALAHRGATVTVTGHGEANQSSIDAQSRGLELALHRAQAIAASLAQAGVPAAKLLIRAEAAGQGGSATL